MDNIQGDEAAQEIDAVDNTELPKENIVQQGPELDREARSVKPKVVTAMALDERGLVKPMDSSEAWRVAELFLKSGAMPKQFENVAQVFIARQFLLAQKINPDIGMRQTTIINGTLSIWGDLPLAICERSGVVEEFREWVIDRSYNEICFENKNLSEEIFAGVCRIKRIGREAITRTFTMDEAKKAGLLDKKNSIWMLYPRRMIQMRTRSLALKDACSDVLSGIAINEYDYDNMVQAPVDVLPEGKKNVAAEINEIFLNEDNTEEGQQTSQPN